MRKNKLLSVFLAAFLSCHTLAMPAWARVDPEPTPVPLPTATVQPTPAPTPTPTPPPQPLTPDGNLTLVDDIAYGEINENEQQFVTVISKSGNYFYLVIDRADDGKENVHFLNQVDEADLMALIPEESAAPIVCSCTDKCHAGAVKTSCELCAVDMTECVGKEPEPEPTPTPAPEPEPEPEPKPKRGIGSVILPLLLVVGVAAGGAVYYLKFRQEKPDTSGSADLDEYDYSEDDGEEADEVEDYDASTLEDEDE